MKPVAGWGGLLAPRSAVVHGAHEPAYELDPGRPEHPRLCHGPIGPGARLPGFPGGTPHAGGSTEGGAMQVLYSRCAGLDVHKDAVVASARPASGRDAGVEAQTFATTTAGPPALSAWLAERGCTHLAMEATGVYWKPPWRRPGSTGSRHGGDRGLLEAGPARAVGRRLHPGAGRRGAGEERAGPRERRGGRDLAGRVAGAHGPVRAGFVPDAPAQALRAPLRTRKQLVRERAGHVQRLRKTLEDARRPQARLGADRRRGGKRARHRRGLDRRRGWSGHAGRPGTSAGQGAPGEADRSAAWAGHVPPPLPAAAPPAPDRRPPWRRRSPRPTERWRRTSSPFAPRS